MTGLNAALFGILMLGVFLLAAGGVRLLLRRTERGKGVLMLVAAAVMFGNVLLWTL